MLFTLGGLGSLDGPIQAQDRAPVLSELVRCRGLTQAEGRLACYDAAAQALDDAERSGEVTVADRAQVRAARTRLFGFGVGSLGVFDRSGSDRLDSIEATVASARQQGRGEWVFNLSDGSTWRQIDAERLGVTPRAQQTVRIREAALGSYLLSLEGGRSIRVRREK